jgi:hypothetical protein
MGDPAVLYHLKPLPWASDERWRKMVAELAPGVDDRGAIRPRVAPRCAGSAKSRVRSARRADNRACISMPITRP